MKEIILGALILSLSLPDMSSAAPSDDQANRRAACKQDIQSFCADVEHGGGRILKCLKEHSDQLSDGCHSALEKLADRKQNNDSSPADQAPGDSNAK